MNKQYVIEKAIEVMRLRHYSPKTERAYCQWIRRYSDFLKARPDLWEHRPEQKTEAFLSYLVKSRDVAASTQNQAFGAILFFYEAVIRQPLKQVSALRATRPVFERTSIPQSQLVPVLNAVQDSPGVPARLICWLLYGCGLRLGEGVGLRLKDVDLINSRLTLQQTKGNKSRTVPLPCALVGALERQVQYADVIWQRDGVDQISTGAMPHALARKYPGIGLKRPWAWLFPAPRRCEWRGQTVRYHTLEDYVQRALRKAAQRFQLDGLLTPHVLRHCFGTHFKGDVQVLQRLLGHAQIQTTMGYRHPSWDGAGSPVDEVATELVRV